MYPWGGTLGKRMSAQGVPRDNQAAVPTMLLASCNVWEGMIPRKENDMADMIKVTGLWKKEGKNCVFYSGSLGYGAQVLVFSNKFKRSEKDPDLNLFIAPKAEPEEKAKDERADDSEIAF